MGEQDRSGRSGERNAGIPVDAFGDVTIDPTKNVLDLVKAVDRRQDDLRQMSVDRLEAEIQNLEAHIKDLMVERDRRYEQRHIDATTQLEAALQAQATAIGAALAASDRAVTKAEAAAEKRFEGVNEFRAQLGDQQRTLMPRVEADNRLSVLAEKIGVLEGFRTEMLSRGSGAKEGYGYAIGLVGLVLVILSIISVGVVIMSRLSP